MPAQQGPHSTGASSALGMLRDPNVVGAALSPDIDCTGRFHSPNSGIRRAEKVEQEGRVTVTVRMDAHDLGALLFRSVGDNRMESALTEAELGAIVLESIVDDMSDLRSGFGIGPESEFANVSVKLHQHQLSEAQVSQPEFQLSDEARNIGMKSYVEFTWSAHVPPATPAEHGVPIVLINSFIQVLKQNGYERHWMAAIEHFHPDWNADTDDNNLTHFTGEGILTAFSLTTGEMPLVPAGSDLKEALRSGLKLTPVKGQSGEPGYIEDDSMIRIRIPLVQTEDWIANSVAKIIKQKLGEWNLKGPYNVSTPTETGKILLMLEYSFKSKSADLQRHEEVALSHVAIYSAIRSCQGFFAAASNSPSSPSLRELEEE